MRKYIITLPITYLYAYKLILYEGVYRKYYLENSIGVKENASSSSQSWEHNKDDSKEVGSGALECEDDEIEMHFLKYPERESYRCFNESKMHCYWWKKYGQWKHEETKQVWLSEWQWGEVPDHSYGVCIVYGVPSCIDMQPAKGHSICTNRRHQDGQAQETKIHHPYSSRSWPSISFTGSLETWKALNIRPVIWLALGSCQL